MTAGLITFFRHHHYGAQLQAYAAMRAITELGHPCEIIDYRPDYDAGLNDLFQKGGLRAKATNLHTAAHYAALKRRAERFDAFVADEMRLSATRYTSYAQLAESPPRYDVYVAGSDQIWNPRLFPGGTFDPAYLQTFVKEGRRISYAPSMGEAPFTGEESAQFRAALEPYSALSVREQAGREKLRAATGREPTVVLDPTLLLTRDQWAGLAAEPAFDHPYILCYYISDHSVLDPYAQAVQQRTGWPIVQLAGVRRKIDGAQRIVLDAGTKEFLGLFRNAAFVCTNSFHGTVFSLLFGKDFYTSVSPKEREHPDRSRVYSLLSRLGCTNRVVGMAHTDELDVPVAYDAVNARLEAQRIYCLDYLRCAIEGVPFAATPPDAGTEKGRTLPKLADRAACTGCSACEQVCPVSAISMEPDQEGFLRPVIGERCILCRKCEGVCPVGKSLDKSAPTRAWAVWNRDDDVRGKSSSGGVFSVLANHVLDRGGAVFGAIYNSDFHGVHHACARSREELAPMRGSKYVQSDLRDSFREAKSLLDQGVPVLFSGVPCQIAGLYAYLGGDRENLLTCDLVCHGVPSPKVFDGFVRQVESAYQAKLKSLTFKDKSKGWSAPHLTAGFDRPWTPAPKGFLRLRRKEQPEAWSELLNNTTYGRGFGMQLFLRPSCGQCEHTHAARPADFTLADYWGLDPKLKLSTDREQGVSMVLVGSEKGQALFRALSPKWVAVERPLEEAVAGNPRLASPLSHNPKRAAFFAALSAQGFPSAAARFLSRPGLIYRTAAKVLTPEMKSRVRKVLK